MEGKHQNKTNKAKYKAFFSVDPQIEANFEKYCEENFINKSKIIEGFMKLIVDKSDQIIELLKNNK
jgi:hypothetical protein